MTFWQKHKWKIIVPVLIVLALAAAFTLGDRDMPKQKDTSEQPTVAAPGGDTGAGHSGRQTCRMTLRRDR